MRCIDKWVCKWMRCIDKWMRCINKCTDWGVRSVSAAVTYTPSPPPQCIDGCGCVCSVGQLWWMREGGGDTLGTNPPSAPPHLPVTEPSTSPSSVPDRKCIFCKHRCHKLVQYKYISVFIFIFMNAFSYISLGTELWGSPCVDKVTSPNEQALLRTSKTPTCQPQKVSKREL